MAASKLVCPDINANRENWDDAVRRVFSRCYRDDSDSATLSTCMPPAGCSMAVLEAYRIHIEAVNYFTDPIKVSLGDRCRRLAKTVMANLERVKREDDPNGQPSSERYASVQAAYKAEVEALYGGESAFRKSQEFLIRRHALVRPARRDVLDDDSSQARSPRMGLRRPRYCLVLAVQARAATLLPTLQVLSCLHRILA